MSVAIISAEDLLRELVMQDVIDRFAVMSKEGQELIRMDYANGYQRYFTPRLLKYVSNPAGYIADNIYVTCHDTIIDMQIKASADKIREMIGGVDEEPKPVNLVKLRRNLQQIAVLERRSNTTVNTDA